MEHALVLQLGLDRRQLAGVRARILSRFADAATFELYPGAQELLRALATRRTIVGVISNWSEPLERILAGLGISGELDFVLASAVERCEKPERAIFERALSRAGVAPERAVHCGDDLDRDVRGARALGILPVLLDRRGEHRAAECERVEDLPQFQRWLHRRTSTT
jgi:putative hydrolase of the HAD superfamily